jgi:hypothetical protein
MPTPQLFTLILASLALAACNARPSGGPTANSSAAQSATAAPGAAIAQSPPASMPIPHAPVTGNVRGVQLVEPKITFLYDSNARWHVSAEGRNGSVGLMNLASIAKGAVLSSADGNTKVNAHGFLSADPKSPKGGSTDVVRTARAYWVQIDSWDVAPWDASKGSSQRAGSASGRFYVQVNDGPNDGPGSVAAGEFHDAEVRYGSDPSKS